MLQVSETNVVLEAEKVPATNAPALKSRLGFQGRSLRRAHRDAASATRALAGTREAQADEL